MSYIVICDFDGTVTSQDVIHAVLDRFAGDEWWEIERELRAGKLSVLECMRRQLALLKVSREEVEKFIIKSVTLDPGFKKLVSACRESGVKLVVLSSGFNLFIELIFKKYGVKGVEYYANELVFKRDRLEIRPLYFNPKCGKCPTCKTNFVKKYKSEGLKVVYVGDGTSDTCPAFYVDILFAKELVKMGVLRGIEHPNRLKRA